MTVLLRVAVPFFLVISFLLPNHYYPWGSFYLEFSAFFFVVCLLSVFIIDNRLLRAPKLFLFLMALACIPSVQFISGNVLFYGDAVIASLFIFLFFISCILGYSIVSRSKSDTYVTGIALSLLVIGIASVWVSLVQWLGLGGGMWVHGIPVGGRPFGNLGQPNNYSTLIFFSYFSLYFLYEKKIFSNPSFLLVSVFLLFGIALGQSRTAWLVFLSLIFAVLISFIVFRAYSATRLIFLVFSVVLLYALSQSLEWMSQYLGLHNQLELRSQVRDVRFDMWQAFIVAIMDNPLSGFGWGQVSVAQLSVAEVYPQNGMTQYTHNLALDLMVWNGIPLGFMVLVLILILFMRAFLNSFSKQGFYFFAGLGALMVHSMLEYPYAYAYFLVLAGLFMGAGAVRCRQSELALALILRKYLEPINLLFRPRFEVGRLIVTPVIVVSLVGLGVIWHEYRLLEEDQRLLRFEVASIGTLRAAERAPDVTIINQLKAFLWVARTNPEEIISDDERELIHRVASRFPLPMPLLKRAQVVKAEAGIEKAIESIAPIRYLYGDGAYDAALLQLKRDYPAGS